MRGLKQYEVQRAPADDLVVSASRKIDPSIVRGLGHTSHPGDQRCARAKFTESQIVATLKQVEGGREVKDVCRELGISDATYYVWKSKYGGMEAADVQRLRDLETEHSKLKRMYAELAMENHALKDVIAKKL